MQDPASCSGATTAYQISMPHTGGVPPDGSAQPGAQARPRPIKYQWPHTGGRPPGGGTRQGAQARPRPIKYHSRTLGGRPPERRTQPVAQARPRPINYQCRQLGDAPRRQYPTRRSGATTAYQISMPPTGGGAPRHTNSRATQGFVQFCLDLRGFASTRSWDPRNTPLTRPRRNTSFVRHQARTPSKCCNYYYYYNNNYYYKCYGFREEKLQ